MLSGGFVLVEYSSGFISTKHQIDINSSETVKEKLTFESETQIKGVIIKRFQNDNGVLNVSYFIE